MNADTVAGTDAGTDDGSTAGSIAEAIARTRDDIERFAARHGREPGSVALLAIGKTKPVTDLAAAIAAGQRAFGENYVDEALEKIDTLGHRVAPADGSSPAGGGADIDPALVWHFVGSIQSRRCAPIAERFDWAHGVDREKIARRLSERRPAQASPLNVCLQLNVDGEASKAGVAPHEVAALAEHCAALPGLRLRGLMAIPAPRDDIGEQRRAFAVVRESLEALRGEGHPDLDTLSMGMSGDLEAAIAEGATIVRIGTALFGARAPKA